MKPLKFNKPKQPKNKKKQKQNSYLWKRFLIFVNEDPFIKGTFLISLAVSLFVIFIFNNVPGLSTTYAYTLGLFFGEFAPIIFLWIFYKGLIKMFETQINNLRYAKNNTFWKYYRLLNIKNYLLISAAVILLTVTIQSIELEKSFLNRAGNGAYYFSQWINSFTDRSLGSPTLPYYFNFGFFIHIIYVLISIIYNHYFVLLITIFYLASLILWYTRHLIKKYFKMWISEKRILKLNKEKRKIKYEKLPKVSQQTISRLSFGSTDLRLVEQVDANSFTDKMRLEEQSRAQTVASTLEMVANKDLSSDHKNDNEIDNDFDIEAFDEKANKENLVSTKSLDNSFEFDIEPDNLKNQKNNTDLKDLEAEFDEFDIEPENDSKSNNLNQAQYIPTIQVPIPSPDALEIKNNQFKDPWEKNAEAQKLESDIVSENKNVLKFASLEAQKEINNKELLEDLTTEIDKNSLKENDQSQNTSQILDATDFEINDTFSLDDFDIDTDIITNEKTSENEINSETESDQELKKVDLKKEEK